ncbi:LysM peptidoglycan-binding domain-containing protein [Jannaschia sp. LMIT008]|uniref:LysM peptidoglycan-binding domain-containing protein n=1 Tax=Jannaschia maritima TaxID=3032585 RepID=UPI002810E02D|nr:LysM peptidoglycan-binding domain-containing protein [Jannaschia sp. LMIT008]
MTQGNNIALGAAAAFAVALVVLAVLSNDEAGSVDAVAVVPADRLDRVSGDREPIAAASGDATAAHDDEDGPETSDAVNRPDGRVDPPATPAIPTAAPSFDLVRVEGDGAGVVAGRAPGGQSVTLRVDGQAVARATADGQGNFVAFLDVPDTGVPMLLTVEAEDRAGAVTPSRGGIIVAPRQSRADRDGEADDDGTTRMADAVEAWDRAKGGELPPSDPATGAVEGATGDGQPVGPPRVTEPGDAVDVPNPVRGSVDIASGRDGIATSDASRSVPGTKSDDATGQPTLSGSRLAAAIASVAGDGTNGASVANGPLIDNSDDDAADPDVGTPNARDRPADGSTLAGDEVVIAALERNPGEASDAAPTVRDGETDPSGPSVGPSGDEANETSQAPPVVGIASPPVGVLHQRVSPGEVPSRDRGVAKVPGAGPAAPIAARPGGLPGRPPRPVGDADAPIAADAPPITTAPASLPDGDAQLAARADPPAPRLFRTGPDGVTLLTRADRPPQVAETLGLDAISYDATGDVRLTGTASPDSELRVYLDNRSVGTIRVPDDGVWSSPLPGVAEGVYTLRIDAVDASGGVASRLETPFQRSAPDLARAARAAGISAITVQPGFTLWAISEGWFGDGLQYVQIFEANRDLIRDPDLIYPGQVFALPRSPGSRIE